MSGNTGDMKKTTPVLTGASNYLEWKSAMKSLLQVMGVWRYANTQVAAVVAGQGGATAEQQATYETNRDKALGTITYYTSALIRQNLMNVMLDCTNAVCYIIMVLELSRRSPVHH